MRASFTPAVWRREATSARSVAILSSWWAVRQSAANACCRVRDTAVVTAVLVPDAVKLAGSLAKCSSRRPAVNHVLLWLPTVLFCSITYVFVKISCAARSNVYIKTSLLRDGIYYNISLYTIQVVDLNFSQACLPFDKISVQWVLKMLQGSVFSWVASCFKHSVAVWRKLKQKITRQFYPNIFFATLSIQLTYFSVECRKLWIFLAVKCHLCFSNSWAKIIYRENGHGGRNTREGGAGHPDSWEVHRHILQVGIYSIFFWQSIRIFYIEAKIPPSNSGNNSTGTLVSYHKELIER